MAQQQEIASGDSKTFSAQLTRLYEYHRVIATIPAVLWTEDVSMSGYDFTFLDDTTAYSYNIFSNELKYYTAEGAVNTLAFDSEEIVTRMYKQLDPENWKVHVRRRLTDEPDTILITREDGEKEVVLKDMSFFRRSPSKAYAFHTYKNKLYGLYKLKTIKYAIDENKRLNSQIKANFVIFEVQNGKLAQMWTRDSINLELVGKKRSLTIGERRTPFMVQENTMALSVFKYKDKDSEPHPVYAQYNLDASTNTYRFDKLLPQFDYPLRHCGTQLGYSMADLVAYKHYRAFRFETDIYDMHTGEHIPIPVLGKNADDFSVQDFKDGTFKNAVILFGIEQDIVTVYYEKALDNPGQTERERRFLIFNKQTQEVILDASQEEMGIDYKSNIIKILSPYTFLYKNADGYLRIGFIK